MEKLFLLGYASGIAGARAGSAKAPAVLQKSSYLSNLHQQGIHLQWEKIIAPDKSDRSVLVKVTQMCEQLGEATANLASEQKRFLVLAGDHTSAIGTWSGVAYAKRGEGDVGLIWIDAHMDSNTPETTHTGNLHGMPLACLLGYGDKSLTRICDNLPKIKPENICLIGIRSYDQGEADLLNGLNVKIFYMEDIVRHGMLAVLQEAIQTVTRHTTCYGISIDIDSMDPMDAPGTGVREPGGIAASELCSGLTVLATDSRLAGMEIVEFDPDQDHNQQTEKLIPKLIAAITLGK